MPPSALSIAWDSTVSGGTSPQTVSFNLGTNGTSSGLSQIGTSFTVGQINQDGVQFGNFSGVTVNQAGIVTANYDNGLQPRDLHRCRSAPSPTRMGCNRRAATPTPKPRPRDRRSCAKRVRAAAGTIAPSSLENSTVDIATEFSNLIVTQRAYEANSKIITTADQMLQTLIQAKQ